MTLKTGIRIIIMFAILITASCASKNFTTTLVPVERVWDSTEITFRIESVTPLQPDEFFMTGYTESDYWHKRVKDSGRMNELAADLQEKASALYPEMFTSSGAALPLHISIVTHSYKNTSSISSFVAAVSWGLFGMILPLPLGFTCDYEIIVSCPEAEISQQTTFNNRLSSWISFPSPLALLPIPKHADQRAWVIYPYQSKYYTGKHFTLECFVKSIVKSIYKADRWTFARAASQRHLSVIKTSGDSVSLRKRR